LGRKCSKTHGITSDKIEQERIRIIKHAEEVNAQLLSFLDEKAPANKNIA